jgi:hypothetical protein
MKHIFWCVRACCASVVFLLTLETSSRIDDFVKYRAPLWGEYTAERLRTIDAEGIRHNVPYARFEKWEHNASGFRGPEVSKHKPEHVVRIACMGTSETYGFFESANLEWPAQLQAFLEEEEPNVRILNTSIVGLGLRTYISYIEKYVLPYEPDIMIVFVNPFSYAASRERALKAAEQPKRPQATPETPAKSTFSFGALIGEMRILPKTKQALKQLLPPQVLKAYQIWDTEKQVQAAEAFRLKRSLPKDEIPESIVEDYRNDLSGLVEFLKDHDIRVILSSYPLLISDETIERHYEIILDNRKFCVEFSFNGMLHVSQKLNSMTQRVATETQVGFIDSEHVLPKNTKFFGDNVHYTNEGATLLAEHMAEYIIQYTAVRQSAGDNL